MDDRALQLAGSFVSPRYIDAGSEALHSHSRAIRSLLAQRRCPEVGFSDELIELLLMQLALMDTNNFPGHVGGGEREGRIVSSLVRRRVYGMTHGVGRSGDLNADQPKAAGSSLLAQLTNAMMLDLVKLSGAVSTKAAGVLPMATGMALALVLRCVANARARDEDAAAPLSTAATCAADRKKGEPRAPPQYVIWPRIDQKTCLKCIEAAGLQPYVVPLRRATPPMRRQTREDDTEQVGEEGRLSSQVSHPFPAFLQVHVDDIRAAIDKVGGPDRVVCVLSTTSCFAPRLPDNVVAISQLCRELDLPYVVNNAYGIQSRPIMAKIDAALRLGRLDYYVQSGDKNFLVPVGGSIVCSGSEERLNRVMALYAGRASAAPVTDLFITALGLGRSGMQKLWSERYDRRKDLEEALTAFAIARGEVLLREEDKEAGDEHNGSVPVGERASDGKPQKVRASRGGAAAACPRNDISFCLTMRHYHERLQGSQPRAKGGKETPPADSGPDRAHTLKVMCDAATAFGAKLFRSGVTGPRVITPSLGRVTAITGCQFQNYGMHQDGDEVDVCPLLVMACGIGMTADEVSGLMARLEELWPVTPCQTEQ